MGLFPCQVTGRRMDCQSVWRPWSVLCSGCCFRAWCLRGGARVLRRPTWGPCGGFALHGGVTRRRYAVRGLRVVQNPHRTRLETEQCALRAAGEGDRPGKVPPQGSFSPRHRQNRLSTNFACNFPRCESTQAQKPCNFNDLISKSETFSGELHAKLSDAAVKSCGVV